MKRKRVERCEEREREGVKGAGRGDGNGGGERWMSTRQSEKSLGVEGGLKSIRDQLSKVQHSVISGLLKRFTKMERK